MTLKEWCEERGISDPDKYFGLASMSEETWTDNSTAAPSILRKQLFLMLYLEYLLLRIGNNVLDLILYADSVRQEGRLKKSKLLFPGRKTLVKWAKAIFGKEDMSQDDHLMNDMNVAASEALYLGQGFGRKPDPEHLPPTTIWEKIGDGIRVIPNFFRSDSSAFGLRVAAATMSVAIVDYLQVSQQFFITQRLLWSMIMIAISMSRTAGQSTMNFLLRVAGTFVAMVGAYIVYYIVDGKTPGVIVFLWLWIFCSFYVVFKVPKLIIVGILSMVTAILIIGYELQVDKLGRAQSEANGQPAYPAYILAPYRLACVAGGLLVAWIWTVFPYPISEHSELRKDLGASAFLLANLFSNVHETIRSRVAGRYDKVEIKDLMHTTSTRHERRSLSSWSLCFRSCRQMLHSQSFSYVLVANFLLRSTLGESPRHVTVRTDLSSMIDCVRRILVATSLMAHASETMAATGPNLSEQSEWSQDFRKVTLQVGQSSHRITSTLSLLSASLMNAQPLPPFLELPKRFEFVERLQTVNSEILSVRHIAEPEYSAFVVIQLCAESLHANLAQLTQYVPSCCASPSLTLLRHVRTLVGEMDFSFHAIPNDSDETLNDFDDSKPSAFKTPS